MGRVSRAAGLIPELVQRENRGVGDGAQVLLMQADGGSLQRDTPIIMLTQERHRALKLAAGFLAFGVVWIVTSDWATEAFADDIVELSRLQTYKGWLFMVAGALFVYVVVARELRSQRRMERELSERDNRFRAMVEQATEVTTTLDRTGIVDYASPAATRLLGWEPGTFDNQNLLDSILIHPDDRQAMRAAFERLRDVPGSFASLEGRMMKVDGDYVLMEHRAHNLLDEPGVQSVVVHSTDITQRRRLEEQLRQSQKMEAVGRLAGGIAHDFNNILTAITGHAEMLLADMAEDPRRTDVEQIQRSAQRATELTRQLLAFSRKQLVRPVVLDLNEVIGRTETMLTRLIGEQYNLELDLQRPLRTVRVDRTQIEQILLNLVVNARDAMPGGGRVTIRTADVVVTEVEAGPVLPAGSYVLLEVEDAGSGIDEAVLSRIFEPFYTTKPAGQGTGLGLSTVYGAVQQSGGHILVRSSAGRGATFSIYLPPAFEPAESPPAAALTAAPSRGTERVLVVEDDDAVRTLAKRMLLRHGYTVIEASSPSAALAIVEGHEPIDVVVSDVVMPEMTGFELATRVLAARPGMPMLLMSGYAEDSMPRNEAAPVHGIPMIEKPFTSDQLLTAVRQLIEATRRVQ